MKTAVFALTSYVLFPLFACSQSSPSVNKPDAADTRVGGRCEGCEAIYECPVPFSSLNETDTLPDFSLNGPKLVLSGTIYQRDGKTPAPGVILYVYHTDQSGRYPTKGGEKGWDKRHGYLRGWVRTNQKGEYRFYTLRPGAYPEGGAPAHIHATLKEPGKTAYWIDEYLFAGDPNLPSASQRGKPKGGDGVLQVNEQNGVLAATRDIILGLNIDDY
jgi:protocatechuate 3,4-dioxygenase beta subunit